MSRAGCCVKGNSLELRRFDDERVEVRGFVVIVLVLKLLETADDEIGPRRQYDLYRDLDDPTREDRSDEEVIRQHGVQGNDVEQDSVCELSDDRRANGAHPEVLAVRPDFHLGQDVIVEHAAHPNCDPAAKQNTRHGAENAAVRLVCVKASRWRKYDRELIREACDYRAKKHGPNYAAGARIAVNLREDVGKNVGDGEKENGDRNGKAEKVDDLASGYVGYQLKSDIEGRDDAQEFVRFHIACRIADFGRFHQRIVRALPCCKSPCAHARYRV